MRLAAHKIWQSITHASVYVAPDAPEQRDMTILIRHGMIVEVGRRVRIPRNTETIPCRGCVAFAGFWNAHVHFMEPKWEGAATQFPDKLSEQMSAMITHSGFTSVVDTGSDGQNTIALRRRVESGEVPGPRIFTAGVPLFPAHALPYYIPAELRAKMAQPETPRAAASVVDANRAAGTDIVKLFTGSIVGPDHIVPMHAEIARAAVEEAHRFGQLVFAHTTNLAGTNVALEAGVEVLAHAPEVTDGMDDAMLGRMVAQHTTIIPTLKLLSEDHQIAKIRALCFRFQRMGGRLVYGTDTGFLPDYDQGEEFRQLMLSGFSFRDVLAMLTTNPAELFRLTSEGKVLPGMRGDLTILSEDPGVRYPEAFTAVSFTIRGGKVIWRSDGASSTTSPGVTGSR